VATIGRFRAVVSVKGIRLSGFAGWLVWMFVHLAFLTGFANRLSTLMHWLRSMIGRGRAEREFSVSHTGGDLSLPDSVLRVVQPSQFPVYEAVAPPERPIEQKPS
jgi:NADH dehydrogenase